MLVLRAATAGDAPVIAATIVAAFEQYRGNLVPESGAFRENAERITGEFAHGSSGIVAEQDGQVLGCVVMKPEDGDLYFGRLSVVPAARGRGIAGMLIEAVEDEARTLGLAGARLSVRIVLTGNQRLFASRGYTEWSRGTHEGFDGPTWINMRKALVEAQ